MSLANSKLVSLKYGENRSFSCEIDAKRVAAWHAAPPAIAEFEGELAEVLAHPLDFPPLSQAVIPGDNVVLALDRHTPQSAALIAATWSVLEGQGVEPDHVLILQPVALESSRLSDPRSLLPESARNAMQWVVHDPTAGGSCRYLASTTSGDRVYLAGQIIDADIVVTIGEVAYDPVLGYRGTNSVFFPGLSNADSIAKAHGQGHSELGPDDVRPLRQFVDEIGWLLGTQFSIQVIPSAGIGASQVLAGAAESVLRRASQLLAESWLVDLESRPDIVVAAVDVDSRGHGWEQVGAALLAARSLVARGGKIVVLSELAEELGPGLEIVRRVETAREAIKPLRQLTPPDLLPATQLAMAADWADVYLLSKLDGDLVEELFMVPLDGVNEAAKLLEGDGTCAFLGSAQHTFGQIV